MHDYFNFPNDMLVSYTSEKQLLLNKLQILQDQTISHIWSSDIFTATKYMLRFYRANFLVHHIL